MLTFEHFNLSNITGPWCKWNKNSRPLSHGALSQNFENETISFFVVNIADKLIQCMYIAILNEVLTLPQSAEQSIEIMRREDIDNSVKLMSLGLEL